MPPVDLAEPGNALHQAVHVPAHKTADAILNDLRYRAAIETDDRRTTSHGFDHDNAERLLPEHRHQERASLTQQTILFDIVDWPDIGDGIAVDKGHYS